MVHLADAGELCPQAPVTAPQRKPAWELADIFRLYGEEYRQNHPLPLQQPQTRRISSIETKIDEDRAQKMEPVGTKAPKLIDRMRQFMRVKHYSLQTEKSHVH